MKKIIPMLLLALGVSSHLYAQKYPIHLTEEGHIIVQVMLNEEVTSNFILDTGAGAIVLSTKTFEKIKSNSKEEGIFTGYRHDGDRIDGIVYSSNSISLGEFKNETFQFGIYPPLDAYGIDGLLSLKFFENQPFTIDFENNNIQLLTKSEVENLAKDNTSVPISLDIKGTLSLDMSIPICLNESVEVDVEFDTGNGYGGVLINPYFMEKLKLQKGEASVSTYQTPISGTVLADSIFTINSVGICSSESISLPNSKVVFRENMNIEGLIGSRLFKDGRVTIDLKGERLIIH